MFIGADTEQLDALAVAFRRCARTIEDHRTCIAMHAFASGWDGVDADRFREDWHYRLAPALHRVETFLLDAGTGLRLQAAQQARASLGPGAATSDDPWWSDAWNVLSATAKNFGTSVSFMGLLAAGGQLLTEKRGHAPDTESGKPGRSTGERPKAPHGTPGETLNKAEDAARGLPPWAKKAGKVLGPLGIFLDSVSLVEAVGDGDIAGMVKSGGSTLLGVAAFIPPLTVPATVASVVWFAAWEIGVPAYKYFAEGDRSSLVGRALDLDLACRQKIVESIGDLADHGDRILGELGDRGRDLIGSASSGVDRLQEFFPGGPITGDLRDHVVDTTQDFVEDSAEKVIDVAEGAGHAVMGAVSDASDYFGDKISWLKGKR